MTHVKKVRGYPYRAQVYVRLIWPSWILCAETAEVFGPPCSFVGVSFVQKERTRMVHDDDMKKNRETVGLDANRVVLGFIIALVIAVIIEALILID